LWLYGDANPAWRWRGADRFCQRLQHSTPSTAPGFTAPQPLPSSFTMRVPPAHTLLGQEGTWQRAPW